jgi:hypothetical protein
MMRRDSPDDVRADASKCPHHVSCLTTGLCGSSSLCGVQSSLGENMLFIELEKDAGADVVLCPYFLSFGNGALCVCPTHYAIHRKERRRE